MDKNGQGFNDLSRAAALEPGANSAIVPPGVGGTSLVNATLSGVFTSVDFRDADLADATLSGTFYECRFCLGQRRNVNAKPG